MIWFIYIHENFMKFLKAKKAFTLIEMLIVIVIIGILASALIPRLTGMQGRARDAARKADLNQLWTAITAYYTDFGKYPGTNEHDMSDFENQLKPYLSSIPTDPLPSRTFVWVWAGVWAPGQYRFTTVKKNWIADSAFIIMAASESYWASSNFVVLSANQSGNIVSTMDANDIIPCQNIWNIDPYGSGWNFCSTLDWSQLRYIYKN